MVAIVNGRTFGGRAEALDDVEDTGREKQALDST